MSVLSAAYSASDAAQPQSQMYVISEHEFDAAFSRRGLYEAGVDTVTSAQTNGIIRNKMAEKFTGMDSHAALRYGFYDSGSSEYTVLKFPFGLYAVCVYAMHEENEYWFFNETDYRFIACTGTLPSIHGIHHCISKNGYMATWKNHAYDSKADISIYRLKDGDVELISRHPNVNISLWEQVCWGADNTFYIRGEYNDDDGLQAEKSTDRYLKFKVLLNPENP